MIQLVFSFFCLFLSVGCAAEEASCLKARLELVNGQKAIYLKGSPYDIGYQQGMLLKSEIAENIQRFITPILSSERAPLPVITHFLKAFPKIIPHIPEDLMQEMRGIADAAEIPFDHILLLNLFPEMFHCTGITVSGDATANGELYHVRVLDYAAGNGLQSTAVLVVVEPDQGIPFLNITYAGFVGCVTGMNLSKIAIGEIGGKGYGHWDGIPMAFLLRTVLQYATSLESIGKLLAESPRTCEYYYVFSDGKTGESCAFYATADSLKHISLGECYPKFSPVSNTFETFSVIPNGESQSPCAVVYDQLKDMIMITRGDRYDLLKNRLAAVYGRIGLTELQEIIYPPIAHQANLHNAIFAPATLDVWIAHAGKNNEPACHEPYHHVNLKSLLGR